jgi:hypothetical protein
MRTDAAHLSALKPGQLVSLLDMLKRYCRDFARFMSATHAIDKLADDFSNDKTAIEPESRQGFGEVISSELRIALIACKSIELSYAVHKIASLRKELKDASQWTYESLKHSVNELRENVHFELENRWFLFVVPEDVAMYRNPQADWGEVVADIANCGYDAYESNYALALGRTTASVFHLMRLIEHGIIALNQALNIESTDNRTWDAKLRPIETELAKEYKHRIEPYKKYHTIIAGFVADLRAVQRAWRNPSIHVELQYDPVRAKEIWNAVRAFMNNLAKGLTEMRTANVS